jgi:hypothetical protein
MFWIAIFTVADTVFEIFDLCFVSYVLHFPRPDSPEVKLHPISHFTSSDVCIVFTLGIH